MQCSRQARTQASTALAVALLWLALFGTPSARAELSRQSLPPFLHPVSDAANVLSLAEGGDLMDLLHDIEKTTDTKIILLIIPTAAPETIGAYVERLANYWRDKGGIREGDRFVFVIIAKEDGMMRVWPGRSLAWIVKPLEQSNFMRNVVPALLSEDKYYQALSGIATVLARLIADRTI